MQNMNVYGDLYQRNFPIISPDVQSDLKKLRVGIAGCGSTGGAVVDSFLRLGIENYHLCDNGEYELNNLNRQMVFKDDVGVNKAEVHRNRIMSVNDSAQVRVWNEGISPENIEDFLSDIDFLFDAVDVTQKEGMAMKLLLHEKACEKGLPVGSALDLGYLQWVRGYNYQEGLSALDGKMEAARSAESPLKILIEGFVPIEDIPYELLNEVERLIKNPEAGACQLGSVCFLLSAMMGPYILNFMKEKRIPPLVKIDLMEYFENSEERAVREEKTLMAMESLKKFLKEIP